MTQTTFRFGSNLAYRSDSRVYIVLGFVEGEDLALRASQNWQALSLSSSSVFAEMTLGEECGDAEPFNIVTEERMKTGFVSDVTVSSVNK